MKKTGKSSIDNFPFPRQTVFNTMKSLKDKRRSSFQLYFKLVLELRVRPAELDTFFQPPSRSSISLGPGKANSPLAGPPLGFDEPLPTNTGFGGLPFDGTWGVWVVSVAGVVGRAVLRLSLAAVVIGVPLDTTHVHHMPVTLANRCCHP